ncbi:ATP-binding protein [Vibrio hepatarius]|uniref:ATP-binding protein n=1 Tax=Vibrio hepatarius TaxID=171383 RepID=UPI00142D637E|nr:ATP-binding protein [Vibrio hepatarius]NIY83877.1 two-component sensor histidine kinase [Vibrio hepatarius]
MLRSFAILWFAVFTPLVLLIIPTDLNPVQAISKSMSGSFFKSVYSGSVNLIEEELLSLSPQEWSATIEQHQQFFHNPLKLTHLEALQDKPEILNEVMAGEVAFEFASPMALFKRVGDSQQVIYYALEESEESMVANQARGALYLAKQDLLKHPQDTWRERLRLNHDELPISVELVQKEQVPTMLLERLQSSTDWLASYTVPETSTIQLLTQVDNRHWILVTDEGSRSVKMKLTTYAVSALFGLVSATLILWVYPLSRDLKRLSRTASEFGQGILTRRAKTSSLSVVSQLSRSFNQMADNIERLIASQRDLTRAVAHDLRTPLYRLRFAMEMLEDDNITPAQKDKYRQIAARSLDNLDHLINQTLLLSRYNRIADISQFSPVNLYQRLESEIEDFQHQHTHLSLRFTSPSSLQDQTVLIDERGLVRALNNLLANAARFAQQTIEISYLHAGSDFLLVVEDDGIGVEQLMRDKIFEPFTQLNNQERASEKGHGLGLAIVKQIAVWHGGDASVEESKLGGARFIIRWPSRQESIERRNVTMLDTNCLKTDNDL